MAATSYASYDDYTRLTRDTTSDSGRVEALLTQQSAKLRGLCSLDGSETLTDDQLEMAKGLVCDAVHKAVGTSSPVWMEGIEGVNSTSMSANGFQLNVDYANASGTAWFDTAMLKAFKRMLHKAQRIGWV